MTEKRVIKNGKIDESKFEKFEKIPVIIEAYQTDEEVEIETLEGVMKANKGDWIIKGVKGELYPCKPDVFDLTYIKVKRMTEEKYIMQDMRAIGAKNTARILNKLIEENNQLKRKNMIYEDKIRGLMK